MPKTKYSYREILEIAFWYRPYHCCFFSNLLSFCKDAVNLNASLANIRICKTCILYHHCAIKPDPFVSE